MARADDGGSIERTEFVRAVFSLLADETRLDIIEYLWNAHGEPIPYAVPKNDLGVCDSGRFNYHLGKLTGTFARKTEVGGESTEGTPVSVVIIKNY